MSRRKTKRNVEQESEQKPEQKPSLSKINPDYIPIVVRLPGSSDIFAKKPDLNFSQLNIDYPVISLGFQHFLHSNKEKTKIFNSDFIDKGKKKVWLVMHKFERKIDNYAEDIHNSSNKYFDITPNMPKILSRGFFKLWEMLNMFDIIDDKQTGFVSAHLAEGPGSFVQATLMYRDKFAKNAKQDKYYAVTLQPTEANAQVQDLEKSFTDYYDKEKPKRFMLYKSDQKGGGDITDPDTVLQFGGQMELNKDKADLVTADGGFDWKNENTQEQEMFRLLFAEIYNAIRIQKKGGSFICKFFETFTKTSLRYIYILTMLYEKVYFVKPLTSRDSNSEKYAVCLNFKEPSKKIMETLDDIFNELHKNKNKNLVGLWENFDFPKEFIDAVILANIRIANKQIRSIGEIMEYINAQNYYGDIYQMRLQMQIDASKYWISRFYGNNKKVIEEDTQKIASYNSDWAKSLGDNIVKN